MLYQDPSNLNISSNHLFKVLIIAPIHFNWIEVQHCIVFQRRMFMNAVRSREEWYSVIQECRSSGLPDKVWCREHGISSSSFYYNIRQLRKQARSIPLSQSVKKPAPVLQEVVPLQLVEEIPDDCAPSHEFTRRPEGITPSVCISNGDITVTCMSDAPASLISSIIQALRTRC